MHHSLDGPTSQERYGLVLVEHSRGLVVEGDPGRPVVATSAWVAPDPRGRAERLFLAGFVLTYLVAFGWFALRAVRWLIDG